MKKDNMKTGLYDELDWLEQQGPKRIRLFWECVFKDSILSLYPKLLMLRNSLMDGQFTHDDYESVLMMMMIMIVLHDVICFILLHTGSFQFGNLPEKEKGEKEKKEEEKEEEGDKRNIAPTRS